MTLLPFNISDSEIEIVHNESEKRSLLKKINGGAVVSNIYINPIEQEIKHLVFVVEGIQTVLIDSFLKRYPLAQKISQYTIISIQPIRKKPVKDEPEFIEQLRKKWNAFGFIKIHEPDIKSILYSLGGSSSSTLIVMQIKKTQLVMLNKKGADIMFSRNNSILLILKK